MQIQASSSGSPSSIKLPNQAAPSGDNFQAKLAAAAQELGADVNSIHSVQTGSPAATGGNRRAQKEEKGQSKSAVADSADTQGAVGLIPVPPANRDVAEEQASAGGNRYTQQPALPGDADLQPSSSNAFQAHVETSTPGTLKPGLNTRDAAMAGQTVSSPAMAQIQSHYAASAGETTTKSNAVVSNFEQPSSSSRQANLETSTPGTLKPDLGTHDGAMAGQTVSSPAMAQIQPRDEAGAGEIKTRSTAVVSNLEQPSTSSSQANLETSTPGTLKPGLNTRDAAMAGQTVSSPTVAQTQPRDEAGASEVKTKSNTVVSNLEQPSSSGSFQAHLETSTPSMVKPSSHASNTAMADARMSSSVMPDNQPTPAANRAGEVTRRSNGVLDDLSSDSRAVHRPGDPAVADQSKVVAASSVPSARENQPAGDTPGQRLVPAPALQNEAVEQLKQAAIERSTTSDDATPIDSKLEDPSVGQTGSAQIAPPVSLPAEGAPQPPVDSPVSSQSDAHQQVRFVTGTENPSQEKTQSNRGPVKQEKKGAIESSDDQPLATPGNVHALGQHDQDGDTQPLANLTANTQAPMAQHAVQMPGTHAPLNGNIANSHIPEPHASSETRDGAGSRATVASRTGEDIAPSVLNTARLIQTMSQSEMRIGLHSLEFGNVSVRTSVSSHELIAQITVDHEELSRTLSEHLPAAQAKLGNESGLHTQIEIRDQNMSFSSGTGDRGNQEAQLAAFNRTRTSHSTEPKVGWNPVPMAVALDGRLDIRA